MIKMRDALNKIKVLSEWIAENSTEQRTVEYANDIMAIIQDALE
jgi:hypothetical protein